MSESRKIEKPEKMYKVLNGLNPPMKNKGFEYELDREYHCDNFCVDPKKDCAPGFYATELEGVPYAWNTFRNIYAVEVWGRAVEIDEYKRRYENIRILRELDPADVAEEAKEIEDDLGYKLSEVIQPVNPIEIDLPDITDEHIELLREWASARASVRGTVWNSARTSVGDSVWNSVRGAVWNSVRHSGRASVRGTVWNSVRTSVRGAVWNSVRPSVRGAVWNSVRHSGRTSVRDSVYAYIGSLFTEIGDWKYIDHEPGQYPYQPAADLWRQGLVPSYDGETWRLHGGEHMEILYEEASDNGD